jgi:adenosine deaminase
VKDIATHPLKLYFDLGCRVTINTDNRLITDTTVSQELFLAHHRMGIPFRDIKAMIVAGFKSSFQPFHEKQAMLRRVVSELERYDDEGQLKPGSLQIGSERPARQRGSALLVD